MARRKKTYQDNVKRWALLRKLRSLMQRSYKLTFLVVVALVIGLFFLFSGDKTDEKQVTADMGGISGYFYELSAKAGLKLELVTFEGDKYIGQAELIEDLGLFDDVPILALDLENIRTKIKERNWIKDAQIHRELPSKLEISIVERQPIAIWQNKQKLHLIDDEGVVLTDLDSSDGLPFPLIVGEGANLRAKDIFAKLAQEKLLYNRVDSAIMVNERRWNIVFMNGISVLMPEENFDEAWKKLARLQMEKRVLDRDIESIDLRMPDRVYIQTRDGVKRKSSRSHSA
jgi:cell division protein FtsQ